MRFRDSLAELFRLICIHTSLVKAVGEWLFDGVTGVFHRVVDGLEGPGRGCSPYQLHTWYVSLLPFHTGLEGTCWVCQVQCQGEEIQNWERSFFLCGFSCNQANQVPSASLMLCKDPVMLCPQKDSVLWERFCLSALSNLKAKVLAGNLSWAHLFFRPLNN